MLTHDFQLTIQEIETIENIYDEIPFRIIERGNAYFRQGAIQKVDKEGDRLIAQIEGSELYKTIIDFEDKNYTCTCPASLPCKHVSALAIWTLRKEKKKLTQSGKKLDIVGNQTCDLVFIIRNDLKYINIFAQDSNERLFKISSINQMDYLKEDWRDAFEEYIQNKSEGKIDYYDTLPDLTVKEIITNFKPKLPLKFLSEKDFSPLEFGGFLECHGLACNLHTEDQIDTKGFYRIHPYYYDPLHKMYRMPPFGCIFYGKIFFIRNLSQTITPEEDFHKLIAKERTELPSNELNSSEESEMKSKFYLFKQVDRKLNSALSSFTFSFMDLYSYRKEFGSFLSNKLKEKFDNVWDKGPAIALHMYVDENEKKYKIKGTVEIVYAESTKYLDPKNWVQRDTPFLPNKLTGFPPIKSRGGYTHLAQDSQRRLVKRKPEKERKMLEKIKIPFSHKKSTGEFAFTTRFLKKFAINYLPDLKEKNVLLRLDAGLLAAINNSYQATFNIESASEIDWFEGKVEISGVSTKDTKAILSAYRAKEEVVKLSSGEWVVVDQLNLDNIVKTLENLGIRLSKNGSSTAFNKGQLIGLESVDEFAIRAEEKVEKLKEDFQKSLRKKKLTPPVLSDSMKKTLRPYQEEGVAFLNHLFQLKVGGILADDMGLGKTVQTIAFIESIIQKEKRDFLFLVICPLAALSVWEMECQRFAPNMKTQVWHGPKRYNDPLLKSGVVITTYMTLSQDIKKLQEKKFTALFIDEAQNIKNTTTKASKMIRQLSSDSFFCLTGTPVENYLSDLWALMDICFPGLLGTKKAFKKSYGSGQRLDNKDNLIKKISPFILRRRKQEVLKELPQKSETLISLPLHESQLVIYEKIRREAIRVLEDAGSNYLILMLPYLMKLRRICCHPDLKNETESELLASSKLSYLQEKIPEIKTSSSGVLIFSQFTDVLKKTAQLLDQEKVSYFYLDGSTTAPKRKEMVAKFQDGEREFFLISLKAGGTALTLHRADTVFHLDPWWNPAAENQATDRVHRIGQKRHVFVYKLIAKETIEEKVLFLQKKKKELFDVLFNEGKNSGKAISRDELMGLLDSVDPV